MITLLAAVTQAATELGLPAPTSILPASDQSRQWAALATREGREIVSRAGDWSALRGEWVFPLVAGQQAYKPPADFVRFVDGTGWDRSTNTPLNGPVTPQEWQWLRSGLVPGGLRMRYRLYGGQVQFDPIPGNADTIAFEYVSNAYAISNGAPVAAWTADTDTWRIADDVLVLGLQWRMLKARGLPYAEERDAYDQCVSRERAASAGARTLPIGRNYVHTGMVGTRSIPDGNWGL